MKSKHVSTKLRKLLVTLLTAALLLSDHTILYAAEAGAAQTAIADNTQQAGTEENADTVSSGDVGDNTTVGKGEKPAENTGNTIDSDDKPDSSEDTSETVSGGDAGTVSGGDAMKPGRLPEAFYEEEIPESYGTLVSYDQYSRTYHVDGNRYVTVVGNDGATYIDDDGSLRPVDNTLEKDTTAVFGLFGGEETSYINRANDYTVVLPENLDREQGKGITIANDEAVITLYPAEGDFTGGLAKDNAVRYSEVLHGHADAKTDLLGAVRHLRSLHHKDGLLLRICPRLIQVQSVAADFSRQTAGIDQIGKTVPLSPLQQDDIFFYAVSQHGVLIVHAGEHFAVADGVVFCQSACKIALRRV